jgi:hypothetical protein
LPGHCTHARLIAVILMVMLLGLQFVNVLSNSHTLVVHRHAPGKEVAAKAHPAHEQVAMKAKAARPHVHVHRHDTGDHSHDLPLRRVPAALVFSFAPLRHLEVSAPIRSVVTGPLERPPKPTAATPFA